MKELGLNDVQVSIAAHTVMQKFFEESSTKDLWKQRRRK
jgi:hypothetical protein